MKRADAWGTSPDLLSTDKHPTTATNNRFFIRLPRNVIALSLVSLFNDASSELIYPLLPLFLMGTLGLSAQFIGLLEGIAESASGLLRFPAGWLSDFLLAAIEASSGLRPSRQSSGC
ncbi:MAG: hypothetical protein M3X11_09540 [Acidobacteriota bacterium]|nr:hypothetical protein [Acidobacteriota bacterium]